MSAQRPWWSRPRSSENGPSATYLNPNPGNLKRSQLVSALSFTSRSKPKRASDIVVSPRSPVPSALPVLADRSLAPSSAPDELEHVKLLPNLPPSDSSRLPLSSARPPRNRLHSKTLPSSTQRPKLAPPSPPMNLKLEPGSGWSSRLGITAFGAPKKTSSNTQAQSSGPSFPRRLTLGKRDRLPLPKAPPQEDLPPTPTSPIHVPSTRPVPHPIAFSITKPNHEDVALSPLSSNSKSSVPSSRVETLSLRPSHSTLSSGTGATGGSVHKSSIVKGDHHTTTHISPVEIGLEGFTDPFASSRSIHTSQHLATRVAPRRQASLQQLKSSSPAATLRHVSSFSPSQVGEVDSESCAYISTCGTGLASRPSIRDVPWGMPEEQPSRGSKYSMPEASRISDGAEDLRNEDARSVFSLPSEKLGSSTFQGTQQEAIRRMQRQHIVPPKELNEWMRASAHPRTPHPSGDDPEPQKTEHDSSHRAPIPPPAVSSSLSCYSSDDQSGTALRPPPRKRLGLAARKQAAVRKKQSAADSQPPISCGIRKLEQVNTTVTNSETQPARRACPPSLHRSASFLTLEEEDDKANGPMLTTEPTGPVAGWDSDTSSEEESFFDFGRGFNSLELSEGLSD